MMTGASALPFGHLSNQESSAPSAQYDPAAQFSAGVVFDNQSSAFSVDPWVRDFAIGDLNDDGLKDLAVISNYTNSICIYNRSADGSFNPVPWRISSPGVIDMRSIVIGDLLAKDGKNDIAVSFNDSSGFGKICILNQSSNFSPKTLTLSGTEPFELTIGQFSGTDNCIAVVCRGDPTASYDDLVEVWKYPFNSFASDHRFHIISSSPAFANSKMISSGDINGDGRDDIVVGNTSGSNVYIMLQPSSWIGSWTTSTKPITGQASDIELADVLGNGRNDLIFANAANMGGSSYVYVYRNDGIGFETPPQTPIRTHLGLGSVGLGEFSGFGGTDLLTLCKSNANASAFFRNSPSSWFGSSANLTFPVDENPLKAIIDRSIPGSEGIFVLSQGPVNQESTITFFKINPSLTGNADTNLFVGSKTIGEMATGRMSNGNVVVASVLPASNEVMLYERNTSRIRVLQTQTGPISVCMGRFNPDSGDDLAVLNSVTGSVSIYNGSTLFTSSYPSKNITLPFTGGHSISAKSIRADGFDDLAIAHDTGVFVLYCLKSWQYFSSSSNESLGVGIAGTRSALAWGDFDGEGNSSDLAILNSLTNTVEVYLRRSPGGPGDYFHNVPSANLTDAGKTFLALAVGDFGVTTDPGNAGRTDIAVLAQGGKVLLYLQPNFGFEAFTFPAPNLRITLYGEAKAISSGDINDDGLDDLMIAYSTLPQFSPYLQTRSLTFINPFNFTTGAEASGILAKDVDGDGRTDLLTSSAGSHSLSIWYQNNLAPLAMMTHPDSADEGTDVTFSGALSQDSFSDINSLNYTWNFGDGSTGYGRMVSHRYLDNRTYSVSLNVTDRGGLSNWTVSTIAIMDKAPSADFAFSPSTPTEGQSVDFIGNSISYPDAISTWDWYFSDTNEHKSGPTTSHTFAQQGDWTVTLTVTDDDHSTGQMIKVVKVNDTHPIASFTANTTSILEGGSVMFNDASVKGTGNEAITSWNWTFGDGHYSNLRNVSHIYASVGNFTVTLRVKDFDDANWNVSAPQIIIVSNVAPLANFDWSPSNPVEMRPISFTDLSWHYAEDSLTNWTWDFGDEEFGYGPSVEHTFDLAGDYDVTLTVWDEDHSSSSTTKPIAILDTAPIANFTIGPTVPVEGSPTYFNSTTDIFAPILYYNWTFSSGPPMQGANVLRTFAQSGWYEATLDVTDIHHKSNRTTQRFWVSEFDLIIDFDWTPDLPLENQAVHLNSTWTSFEQLVNWTWTIDSLAQLYGREVNFTFGLAGAYNITLTVLDSDGSSANLTKRLQVGETYPFANFTIWPAIPDEGSWVAFNDTSQVSGVSGIPIVRWQWEFDGEMANGTSDARSRFEDGTHWARLTVWDSHGTSNSTSPRFFTVNNLNPRASFEVDRAVEGSPVHLNSTSTYAFNQIVRYNWTLGGDGFGADQADIVHSFMEKGWRNITLTVWDDQNHSSSCSRWIYVNSTPPKVSLQLVGSSIEGTTTSFNLTATSFNTLVSWNWTYDGNQTWHLYHDASSGATFNFAFHGRYWVGVNVTELDGDWTVMSIPVDAQNTSPQVFRLWSSSLTCDMDHSVDFWVTAEATYRPIDRYEWNFDYGSGGSWSVSDPKLANHTTFNFVKPGDHFVMVRVWDNDSYSQFPSPLQIYVNDLRPVARFSYLNSTQVSGRVQFDASLSTDSLSDMSSLSYRWNFGDNSGWTSYSESNKNTYHDFPADNRYTVTLQVRDQWGMTNSDSIPVAQVIVVDRLGPELVMKSTGENSTAGQIIVISAQVTDAFGVKEVMLAYRLGNGTWTTIPMTPTEQAQVYAGQIPAQAQNTTLYYQVHATDMTNNTYSTQVFQITVRAATEQANDLLWIVALLVVIIVALVLFILLRRVPVDEVFIIYEDGRLMAHQTRRLKPGMDDEILSSMLIAIQSFVKDSFKDESSTHLQRLDFGEKKILVERGDSFYLAVVLHSNRAGNVPQRMQAVIEDIHKEYGTALKEWDGDLEKVRGIKDQTDKLFKTPMPLALSGRRERGPAPMECPICGSTVEPNTIKCPSCGIELSMSTVDDMEDVANNLRDDRDKQN
jgi:PKD repeat protein